MREIQPISGACVWHGRKMATSSRWRRQGSQDVEPSAQVRIYHYAGTQHASATWPLTDSNPLAAPARRARGAGNRQC